MRRAFTLIELLIVVSIIAVLAAIAMPNYLEAQTRTKVVRAKSDMRAVAVAIETYRLDNSVYPPATEIGNPGSFIYSGSGPVYEGLLPPSISTPISYIYPLPRDPFPPAADGPGEGPHNSFHYLDRRSAEARGEMTLFDDFHEICFFQRNGQSAYWLFSVGPDLEHDRELNQTGPNAAALYDPTNGTVSNGDVYFFQSTGLRF